MFDGVVVDRGFEWSEEDFAFDVWAWNVLMQTTTADTRERMQLLLMLEEGDIAHMGPVTAVGRAFVIDAMLRYHPHHAVTEQEWRWAVGEKRFDARRFIEVEHAHPRLNGSYVVG
jgi:hypothetical protein